MQVLDDAAQFSGRENRETAIAEQLLSRSVTSQVRVCELVYDLRLSGKDSEEFYRTVSEYAERVLAEIELRAGPLIDAYAGHVRDSLCEAERSRGEYGLDLLILGLSLHQYLGAAEATPGWVVVLAHELYWLRTEATWTKTLADLGRAALNRFYLRPSLGRQPKSESYTLQQLRWLIDWLQSTGEFDQEVRRLNNWRSLLSAQTEADAGKWMRVSVELVRWFEGEAAQALGAYTEGVPRFLEGEYMRRRPREDEIFCGRARVEYHLAMVAAELMNRGLRSRFEQMRNRVVLLPTCMRSHGAGMCRARDLGGDLVCSGCDPLCTVNCITERMHKLGAEVYMVPHSTGFSRWLTRWQREPDTGVIAIACLMNILPGGYEIRARRIAAQCVPLDYPGCAKHWRRQGLPTGIHEERLVELVTAPHPRRTMP